MSASSEREESENGTDGQITVSLYRICCRAGHNKSNSSFDKLNDALTLLPFFFGDKSNEFCFWQHLIFGDFSKEQFDALLSKLEFHGTRFFVASSWHPRDDVGLRNKSGSWNLENDTTNGQHYTAADRRPTNQVRSWQAGRGSHPTVDTPTSSRGNRSRRI